MPRVAIFRHTLLPISESFIATQAAELTRYRPVFVGRERGPLAPPGETRTLADETTGRWRRLWRRVRYTLSGGGGAPMGELLAAAQPDLVHAHFGVDGVYAARVRRGMEQRAGTGLPGRVPLVVTFHGFDATRTIGSYLRAPKVAHLWYLLRRRALAKDPRVHGIAVSRYIAARLAALGFPPERVHLHYIGIDPRRFAPSSAAESRAPAGAPRVLTIARLVEKKGTVYLLRAVAALAARFPALTLRVIGEGPLRGALEGEAARLGIADRVVFLGAQPGDVVRAELAAAGLFALTSVTATSGDAEGMGIVLLEAAATGLPVIASHHGGMVEAVIDGETGLLCPERDVTAIAAAIEALITNPDRARTMGAAGRAMVEKEFDVRTQTAKLEQIYDRILGDE